jgi:ssDNA-binding Zn-finger/Zn-ribbon topoisomerase 1
MKKIQCYKCGKHLGEITKGKLHKDLFYICRDCIENDSDYIPKQDYDMPEGFADLFNMVNKYDR